MAASGVSAFSQFFVLSGRGDIVVSKDYRGDVVKGTQDIFWRKIQAQAAAAKGGEGASGVRVGAAGASAGAGAGAAGEAVRPMFNINGINFIYIKRKGLYLVFTTKFNVSPVFAIELLDRFVGVLKDYTGTLSESSLRRNFVLVYEILDEMLDFGFVQSTTSEHMRAHVVNKPEAGVMAGRGEGGGAAGVAGSSGSSSGKKTGIKGALAKLRDRAGKRAGGAVSGPRVVASSAARKPITLQHTRGGGDEVFVDLLERLIVVFAKDGTIVRSQIDGALQVKAFVSGSPALVLALNDNLSIGADEAGYGIVVDDISFHESVDLESFDANRTLAMSLTAGETTLMSYRLKSEFRIPFRVFVFLEEVSPSAFEVVVRIRADFPDTTFGKDVSVAIPLPATTYNATLDLPAGVGGQTYSYAKDTHTLTWDIKKFRGGAEHHARAKVHLDGPEDIAMWSNAVGPVSLAFEIPMHSLSGMAIRSLRIMDPRNPGYKPERWVRYVSHSDSYVCRV